MARRKSRSRQTNRAPRGKSERERRVEMITWALLVMVFAILQIVPEGTVPNPVVPMAGAIIILGSAFFQYGRGWRVSPITWLAGIGMAGLTYYNFTVNAARNFTGESLLIFAAVIVFGVITGET